jgi:beta-mannosidase
MREVERMKLNRIPSIRTDLCGRWMFAWSDRPLQGAVSRKTASDSGMKFYPCKVPGNFELDLHSIGYIPDPFHGMNPVAVRKKTERCHVYYAREFESQVIPDTSTILVFEGLDCFSDIYVNGILAASTDNMLIEHEVDLSGVLVIGTNELFIHIRPAILEARKFDYPQLMSGDKVNFESLYVRKAPHMFGWDIMPRFLSAGIFRPVFLDHRASEGIEEVYLKTVELSHDHTNAKLVLHYRLRGEIAENDKIRLEMIHDNSIVHIETTIQFAVGKTEFDIPSPDLWWSKGRGDPSLYDVEVALCRDGNIMDRVRFNHGIRKVTLKRTATTTSTGDGEFVFIVNDEKVFIKGTNWVPVDAFHSRDLDRIPSILCLVNDLNCNMIRCWGGNIYEDDLFYDICDKSGILVWQDFCMACGIYPQDDDFVDAIAKEATSVVKRLRQHASVVLWSGDNECDEAYVWNHSGADPNSNLLTRKIIPEVIRLHDGTRPYIPSSPFYDQGLQKDDTPYLPEAHLWGARDYYKSKYYMAALCHFVSEFGYHGCPSPDSVKRFITQEKLWPPMNNEEWTLHGTSAVPEAHMCDYRVELMSKQITELFTVVPDELDEFSFASQAVQAEAMKFLIELFRMGKWRRTGILWWNVMDGWPQFSDAVVDYYFVRKLAYGFIKNCQQDLCVMLAEPEDWNQSVVIVNDTRQDLTIDCRITDIARDEVVFEGRFKALADRAIIVGQIRYVRSTQRMFSIFWEGEARGHNHYLAGQPPFVQTQYRDWLDRAGLIQK